MPKKTTSPRKESSLSRDRIVEAAIGLLDRSGEAGLTFRNLSERLATGAGAIYWHIDNKRDLLLAACDEIVREAVDAPPAATAPADRIRSMALNLFDAMDNHPWVGAALAQAGGELPVVRILEALGQPLQALGVGGLDQWPTSMALMNYILGVASQNATRAQLAAQHGWKRDSLLAEVSQAWDNLDAEKYPFTRSMARQLAIHDDRADFLAGVELILGGIRAHQSGVSPPTAPAAPAPTNQ